MDNDPDPVVKVTLPKAVTANLWLASRVWIAVVGGVVAVALFGAAIILLILSVRSNQDQINEFRYRSCIEDSVVNLTVSQGVLIKDAFARDAAASARDLGPYGDALEALRQSQASCRQRFPSN